jgi:hypothetical protein
VIGVAEVVERFVIGMAAGTLLASIVWRVVHRGDR